MKVGAPAIDKLLCLHPNAHRHFGTHRSADAFAVILSSPNWIVVEHDSRWVFAERHTAKLWEVHWFFPHSIHMPTLRRLTAKVFDITRAQMLFGEVPKGAKTERQTRVVARALGMDKVDGMYLLTRERFYPMFGLDSTRED